MLITIILYNMSNYPKRPNVKSMSLVQIAKTRHKDLSNLINITFNHKTITLWFLNVSMGYFWCLSRLFSQKCQIWKRMSLGQKPKPPYKFQVSFLMSFFLTKRCQHGFWMYYCDKCNVFKLNHSQIAKFSKCMYLGQKYNFYLVWS